MIHRLLIPAIALLTIAALAGCSKITRDNFAKIEPGMSPKQVEAILGPPTSSKSVTVPIVNIEGTEYQYTKDKSVITLRFVNDKLVDKSANFE